MPVFTIYELLAPIVTIWAQMGFRPIYRPIYEPIRAYICLSWFFESMFCKDASPFSTAQLGVCRTPLPRNIGALGQTSREARTVLKPLPPRPCHLGRASRGSRAATPQPSSQTMPLSARALLLYVSLTGWVRGQTVKSFAYLPYLLPTQ